MTETMQVSESERDELVQTRSIRTALPGPKSAAVLEAKSHSVSGAVGATMPAVARRATGGIIEDLDGNRFIDFASGIGVTGVGNAAPAVANAIGRQARELIHTAFTLFPYPGYVDVADRLNRLVPGEFEKRTALFNSGSEAVENAVKIARRATGRPAVVSFDNGFHGRTNLGMALTARNSPYKEGFGPFASDVYRVPGSYPFRDAHPNGFEAARASTAAAVEQVAADQIAAVIIEPIQGEGGIIVPASGFFAELRRWTHEHGIVLIADEIQAGFARTGAWFSIEHENVAADLVAIAKGVAGGMPLSAVTGRATLMDAAQVGGIGGTFGGNPVACAAALSTIETIEDGCLLDRAVRIGAHMHERFEEIRASDPRIGEVRGRGAMMAIELVVPETCEPDPQLTAGVISFAQQNGVVLMLSGTHNNVIRFLPPFVIGEDLLDDGIDVVEAALRAM